MNDQRPTAEIDEVSQSTYAALRGGPHVRTWLRRRKAICFYGHNQPARNVQIHGLQDAARTWRIPFYYVTVGDEAGLEQVLQHDSVLFITTVAALPGLAPMMGPCNGAVALIANYYDDTPNPRTIHPVSEEESRILDEHGGNVCVALSECSPEWAERYCRGYVENHGIPVMSFTWGINLLRHYPVQTPKIADLVFLGTYFEKGTRVDDYFGEPLRRFSSTVVGHGWSESPFDIPNTRLEDFNGAAPTLYSGHTISLNVHHGYEEAGHTCNERAFNVPACGGFMVSDYAPRIHDFFPEDEAVVADGPADFLEKVEYFVRNPDERIPYVQKARRRVVAEHTYHHRLCDLLRFAIDGDTVYNHCPVMGAPARS